MGIDANFKFNIPQDADFPDDVAIERDDGETREYVHPGILREADRELTEALEKVEALSAEYSDLRELAEEFVEGWLGDGDGTDFDGLAARIAKALDSGREEPNDG